MKSETDVLVPPDLLAELRAAAEEDQGRPSELVGEALQAYLSNRRSRRLVERGQQRARELGFSESDLPRLIAESRQERR